MKKIIRCIAIAGGGILALTVILGIIFTSFLVVFLILDDTQTLVFKYANGDPADCEVYLNGEYIGKTQRGKIYLDEFTPGELIAKGSRYGKEYEATFQITPEDDLYRLDFMINMSQPTYSIEQKQYGIYIEKVELDDKELRIEAINAASECISGDRECQLIRVYEHLVHNYKYFADSRDDEHIQTPFETREFRGGDCEDLTILLTSLLENIGIETYFVFTEDHIYSLACDIDPGTVYNYTLPLYYVTRNIENSTTEIQFEANDGYYFGGDETFYGNLLSIFGSVKSEDPVTIFAIRNKTEFDTFLYNRTCNALNGSYQEGVKSAKIEYMDVDYGGIVIHNPSQKNITVELTINAYLTYPTIDPDTIEITTYDINGKTCIPLDPTLGEDSYAGSESDIYADKVFINTLTNEKSEFRRTYNPTQNRAWNLP